MTKQEIIDKFSKIMCSQPGICGFISEQHGQQRFERRIAMFVAFSPFHIILITCFCQNSSVGRALDL